MNILYFGTVCSEEEFEEISQKSAVKPSAAPQTFETLLLKGFSQLTDVHVECHTFPPVPARPQGYLAYWGKKKNQIANHIYTTWIPAINIQILKQVCYFFFAFFLAIKWAINNRHEQEKAILLYSIYAPIGFGLLLASKLTRCPVYALVPDLPQLMFSYAKERGIKAKLVPIFIQFSRLIQSQFDGYILLTQWMNDIINQKNKPFIVMEGVAEDKEELNNEVRSTKKAIMYAGALHYKFGIDDLIQAFQFIHDDELELWLFGTGDMEEKITKYSQANDRIKFFGRKPKKDILSYEKQATLLVNIRSSADAYTKYSFPSKTIEYMASGTPLLTTKLPGIPEEYYEYCFSIVDESILGISEVINQILLLPRSELDRMGNIAKDFIIEKKNGRIQANKIYQFFLNHA